MEFRSDAAESSDISTLFFVMPVMETIRFAPPGGNPAIIVAGRVQKGQLNVGETVELISPTGEKHTATVGALVVPNDGRVDQIRVGDNAQCLLHGIDETDIERDQVLVNVRPRVSGKIKKIGEDIAITYEFT